MRYSLAAIFFIISTFISTSAFAGTISGQINFTGTAPEPTEISMDADPTCSGLHDDEVYTEEVVVNDNGTLKNVFVYIKEGLEGQTFETPTEMASIDQKGCTYVPHVQGVQVNQTIEIQNSDSTLHNVHALPKESKEFNLGMPIPGMKLKKKFDTPEVMVKFKCDVHPWMNAYVGVVEHPFFSVSGDDGAFTLENVPAGDYVVEVWHEKYGTQTQNVSVADGDVTLDFTYTG